MTIQNITDREIALQARVAELEAIEKQLSDNVIWQAGEIAKHLATIEVSRKQMESQKDEWLSWNEKRTALTKDAERYRWLREQVYVDKESRLRIARTYLLSEQGTTLQQRLDAAIDAAMGGAND